MDNSHLGPPKTQTKQLIESIAAASLNFKSIYHLFNIVTAQKFKNTAEKHMKLEYLFPKKLQPATITESTLRTTYIDT